MIKLGRKLENPYTVENMREAYANLVNQGVLKSGLVIDATHIYIRVLPATEQEMNEFEDHLLQFLTYHDMDNLEKSITGHFFSYPLDYEILEGGVYFYDPQLPPGGITWQYTVVPAGYTLPPIQHEVIDELFLKCDFSNAAKSTRGFDQASWQLLEAEALRLAGDPDAKLTNHTGLKGAVAWWTPEGTITAWDHELRKPVPVQGAKVRARRWFRVRTDLTDNDGVFVMRPINREVRYSIVWERRDWDIRSGKWGQAMLKKPGLQTVRWDPIIMEGPSLGFATVHRALIRYYYSGDRLGLKSPYYAPFGRSRLKVGYFHEGHWTFDIRSSVGYAIPYWNIPTLPHINISGVNASGIHFRTNHIFGITINELAHVSHWDMLLNVKDLLLPPGTGSSVNPYGFGQCLFALMWLNIISRNGRIIVEGWSNVVDWALTNREYKVLQDKYFPLRATNYNHRDGRQEWNPDEDPLGANPLFIDLIDDYNQRLTRGGNRPDDNVRGFSICVLENKVLKYTICFSTLRSRLKANKPQGVTDAQIDTLIDFYENL